MSNINLPLTLDAKGLSVLMHKAESSILRDVTRDKENRRQPPHIKTGKKPIWFSEVAVNWLAGRSSELVTIKIEFYLKPTAARSAPPVMRSIAEDLMVAMERWQA